MYYKEEERTAKKYMQARFEIGHLSIWDDKYHFYVEKMEIHTCIIHCRDIIGPTETEIVSPAVKIITSREITSNIKWKPISHSLLLITCPGCMSYKRAAP
jgi:hypothetical protein